MPAPFPHGRPASAHESGGGERPSVAGHRQVALPTPERIVVVEWPGTGVPGAHRPGTPYVHAVWLGVLGPSATLAWERLARQAAAAPGSEVGCADLARSFGLGDSLGHNAPLSRSLARLVAFGAASRPSQGSLAVRLGLPDVSARQLARLSRSANIAHQRWAQGLWQPAGIGQSRAPELVR